MSQKKFNVELGAMEYQALLNNSTISSMCKSSLRSPKKIGEFVMLRMTHYELEDLVGWAAAEANHAKTDEEEYLLGSAFESLESALFRIR
ncbi:hypothetical protein JW935_00295 [candidate division KSB1 bacterium]|nr:hypothetical protein [candidate division KSB1 bacterium]